MHLELSPEEFERLLKLAYLGEAVANDWTPADRHERQQLGMTDILYELCARAKDTPAAGYAVLDEKSGEWMPSAALDQEMDEIIGRYDNEVFWDELMTRMTRRDLLGEYGQASIDTMSDVYKKQAEQPLMAYYSREVREHGLDRFMVNDETNNKLKNRSKERDPKRDRKRPESAGNEKNEG